jgi:acyl-CoA synthetase (AMP-forming)/AMP-acid ligase II
MALRSFPPECECHVFRTSGTSTRQRGELHLDTLALYEASLLPSFERHLLPDLRDPSQRMRIAILAPSPIEAPDSSLSHMFGVALERRGDPESGFLVEKGELRTRRLCKQLEKAAASDVAVLLCGTAFAFVHLLENLESEQRRIALPAASRAMETGGFKGRARELPRGELYRRIHRALGVPPDRIVNQYGMTELGSQFYDSVLRLPGTPRRKLGPPWARVRLVDPESGEEAPRGEIGMVTVLDLTNTGSVLAIQSAYLGRALDDGFQVLGREAGAEERGCSIAADEMLRDRSRGAPRESGNGRLP